MTEIVWPASALAERSDVQMLLAALDVGSLSELHRLVECGRPDTRLSIIGLDYVLVAGLAKELQLMVQRRHDYGPLRDTRRGRSFEVRLDAGRIAKVTVELDRVEQAGG